MKRILYFLAAALYLCAPASVVRAQEAHGESICIAEGKWERGNAREVNLYGVDNGNLVKMASSVLTPGKRFYLAFAPEAEGFYVVGTNGINSLNNYMFYFKPGDRLRVEVGAKSYRLTDGNTPENMEMERWHGHMLPLESKSVYFSGSGSTYVDFFPALEEKAAQKYEQKYTANPEFNKAFAWYREFDMVYNAVNFIATPRSVHPGPDDYPEYYARLDLYGLTRSGDLLRYPYGMFLIRTFSMTMPSFKPSMTEDQKKALRDPIHSLDFLLPMIGNDTLRGETVLQRTGMVRTYEGFLDFDSKYGKYLVTGAQKDRLKRLLSEIPVNGEGQPAVDFRFPDAEGNEIALSDFKGKVVYVDVWATWCGPCRAQIPALKELEKEYHGRDVVFLGVSTDKSADRQKWLDMIAEKELAGVQLHAGDRARLELSAPYRISGIPRFILVDRNGNIISSDAPRPGSAEIRPVLDAALKK